MFTLEFDDFSAALGRAWTSLATWLQRRSLMKISTVTIQDVSTLSPAASLMDAARHRSAFGQLLFGSAAKAMLRVAAHA